MEANKFMQVFYVMEAILFIGGISIVYMGTISDKLIYSIIGSATIISSLVLYLKNGWRTTK